MKHVIKVMTASLFVFAVAGCAHTDTRADEGKPEAKVIDAEPRPYDPAANAQDDIDAALLAASEDGKMIIVAMGGNWCHDSRSLAAQFEKPRFQKLLNENFHLVYVDVGRKDRNIDIANTFGLDEIVGTPTVFVLSPTGDVLNFETAPTWRNAANRSEDEIWTYFNNFTVSGFERGRMPTVSGEATE